MSLMRGLWQIAMFVLGLTIIRVIVTATENRRTRDIVRDVNKAYAEDMHAVMKELHPEWQIKDALK